jgi:DNA-binding transcriptional ArsR family regulator
MPDPLDPPACARKLSALAAPERLRIIRYLRGGEHNVGEIADALGLKLVNVSHHLNVLYHASLVESRKQGRHVYYFLPAGSMQADGTEGAREHLDLGCCRLELPNPSEPGPGS